MAKRKKISRHAITQHLRELGNEVDQLRTVDGETQVITRVEALAELVWKRALGWIEDLGGGKKTYHKPEPWAIQLIYERIEGRVPQVIPSEKSGATIADRVGDLGKQRINSQARAAVALPGRSAALGMSDNGPPSSEGPGSESHLPGENPPGRGG